MKRKNDVYPPQRLLRLYQEGIAESEDKEDNNDEEGDEQCASWAIWHTCRSNIRDLGSAMLPTSIYFL